jgi:glucose/arabinose dehydrogenase/mono/diheme cytochrome c family protein
MVSSSFIRSILLFGIICQSCREGKHAELMDYSHVTENMFFATPRAVSQDPVSVPMSPSESLATFRIPEGYELELVASEPTISEPVAIAWDGNGRMYVAQMETYMQTVDAVGQDDPRSRIMLLEDTNNDGRMDKSTVFLDSLRLPRMLLTVGEELFVNETNTFDIYAYKDTNGDGKADQKRPVFQSEQKAFGNVEHQRSGLDWNLDNWIYVTTDPVRFKYQEGMLKVDSLAGGSNGQWGLTHDNHGRLFFSRAAAGKAATGFQLNPFYGQLDMEEAYSPDFNEVWPVIKTPDVNGGPKTLRADSTVRTFTSAAGQSVYRGDRLPKTMKGDYVVAEPVGRIIRRAKISTANGIIKLENAYDQEEFISSTDMNFRPVNTYTGPDGCLYIVDMYRGIIQESTWAQPGSYLYAQIMNKGLAGNVRNGRIYRLVHKEIPPGPKPNMLEESSKKLVTYLDHPNGWWRDNAQKEIIIRGDKSVVKDLKIIAKGDKGPLSEIPGSIAIVHALWTLEGLDALDLEVISHALKNNAPEVRKTTLWAMEPYLKSHNKEIMEMLEPLKSDPDPEVRFQLLLSLQTVKDTQAAEIIEGIEWQPADSLLLSGITRSLEKNEEAKTYGAKLVALNHDAREMVIRGATIFKTLCIGCHGPEGQGLPGNIAPPLIGKFKLLEYKKGVIKIMLHGLEGPVDGQEYSDIMPPMGEHDDEWIASVLNYVRYDLSMKSFPTMNPGYLDFAIIQPEQVRQVRNDHKDRKRPWTWEEIKLDK